MFFVKEIMILNKSLLPFSIVCIVNGSWLCFNLGKSSTHGTKRKETNKPFNINCFLFSLSLSLSTYCFAILYFSIFSAHFLQPPKNWLPFQIILDFDIKITIMNRKCDGNFPQWINKHSGTVYTKC